MKGVMRECSYNEESEEHIRGIGIILDYMKEAYRDIKYEFRYKLPNNKYADLYFKFEDGNDLAIEFERQDLDFEYWEEKHNSFKSLNIKDLWFIKMDNSWDINILYDLSFYKRVVLNNTNELLLLNIENRDLTIARKMEYRNELNVVIDNDIFKHTYKLGDTKILSSGEIVTTPDFNNMFNEANEVFNDNCDKEYNIKKEVEKQKKLNNIQNSYVNAELFANESNIEIKKQNYYHGEDERMIYGKPISEDESKAKVHEIIYKKQEKNNMEEKSEEYRQILNKAVNSNYDKYYIEKLSREMNYEADTYDAIKRGLLKLIEKGNEKAKNFYEILYK
ncbi:hypothetical protein G9F71_010260 [Clostridium sp. FP2]|uniref:competence protein CoiA family protein n=1 Tax=Clostridium sp. FP2 TaxID=2724481 RepID=UPI0013E93C5B|nr:hypothetical protein [Clostridium sp. FP2]MBZ9623237.1 hypothetical protein [Clostridium sp. FP2]